MQSSKINESLQYTAAYAQKAKHDPLAAKHDTLCQAYQVALQRIDPKNPSVAKGAIDQVLATAQQLQSSTATLKAAAEKAYNAWTARQGDLEKVTDQIREMVEWGHPKAAPLQQVLDAINGKANERAYEEALKALEQLLGKAAPIWEDYQKQKEAQGQYDQALPALQPRLDAAATCSYKKLEQMKQDIATAKGQMEQAATGKDYVSALAQLKTLETNLTTLEQEEEKLKAKKEEYEKAKGDADPKATKAAEAHPYKATAEMDQPIQDLKAKAEKAAADEDYEQAAADATELNAKLDDKLKKVEELDQARKKYEDGVASLKPRLDAITTCDASASIGAVQQALDQKKSEMEAAAEADDYEKAAGLVTEVEAKLKEYEDLVAKRDEYKTRLEALKPDLDKTSVSKEHQEYLQPIQTDMASKQTEMEGAAQAEDYENALALLEQLEGLVKQYFEAIEQKKQEYEKAAAGATSKSDEALVTANDFKDLKTQHDDVSNKFDAMRAAADKEDWQTAKELADDLDKTATDYLKAAAEKQKEFDDKAKAVEAKMDDANYFTEDNVAREAIAGMSEEDLKHLPAKTRNRLLEELQEGNFSDEDKAAAKKLYSVRYLDPEFEKLDKKNREMLDKLKSDPQFKDARANWATMPDDKKMEVLQKVADIQADAYGTPKTTLAKFDPPRAPEKGNDGKMYITNGEYGHDDGRLMLNTHPQSAWNNFDSIMDTTVHENGHRQQSTMIDDYNAGKIKPGDPRYEQAKMFKLNDTQHGYYTFDKPEYFTQPQETHSRITGEALTKAQIGKS